MGNSCGRACGSRRLDRGWRWFPLALLVGVSLCSLAPGTRSGAIDGPPGSSRAGLSPADPRVAPPGHGFVPAELIASPDAIFSRAGSFSTEGPGLPFPEVLRAARTPLGAAYFIVQLHPDACMPGMVDSSLRRISAAGARIVAYIPNNAWIIEADVASLADLRSAGPVRYLEPYHPAYKIAPGLVAGSALAAGMSPLLARALIVTGFPGLPASVLAAQVRMLGGKVTHADDGASGATVLAELPEDRIVPLARLEGIRTIDENVPRHPQGEEIGWNLAHGTYLPGYRPPLFLAGIDGSGRYLVDVDNPPLSAGNLRVAGPEDVDWNGNGVIDNAAQIIALTDTGMNLANGDFSDKFNISGWNGNGGPGGPNVPRKGDGHTDRNHRKIAWYEVAPGGFGDGDLSTCDPGASHGTIVASVAAGNASSGPFAADLLDWSGDGTPDDYGDPNSGDSCGPGYCFPSGGINYRVDGVAPGARLLVQDLNSTCPEPGSFASGSFGALLGDARSKGARVHLYPFGALAFPLTQYDVSAQAIDDFLAADANRDYMLFLAAGNYGSATAGTGSNAKARTLVNEASSKNAVAVGGTFSGSAGDLRSRPPYSSVGPAPNGTACPAQTASRAAPSNCGRIKPDLMAPTQDGGGTGLEEVFWCLGGGAQTGPVGCTPPFWGGGTGTSTGAAAAAGAAALIRDYFARGFQPRGVAADPWDGLARRPHVSGALVKALLVASADDMAGSGLNPAYRHRHNPETGYGAIDLRNILPLAVDPRSPSALLVHDAGCPETQTCPSDLPFPPALGAGQSASAEVDIPDARKDLRVVLDWVEPSDGLGAGALRSDLDLEVRYCGPDQDCASAGGACSGGPSPGLPCSDDSACTPVQGGACDMDRVWYGNVYTEDFDDDGTEDRDLDGSPGLIPSGTTGFWRSEGPWSLANRDADADGTDDDGAASGEVIAPRDIRNNVEAVHLSADPEADGTDAAHDGDRQLRQGRWRIKISRSPAGPGLQKYALALAWGQAGTISTLTFDRADKNRLEWLPIGPSVHFDVATRQGLPISAVSPLVWLGPAGYFDTFSCRQDSLACTDLDRDGRCEASTASDGAPSAGTLDLWLVREDGGSWLEAGSGGLTGPDVTRDTRMRDDGSPVCP